MLLHFLRFRKPLIPQNPALVLKKHCSQFWRRKQSEERPNFVIANGTGTNTLNLAGLIE